MNETNGSDWPEGMQALGRLASWQMMMAAAGGPVHPASMQANHPGEIVALAGVGQAATAGLKVAARLLKLNPDGASWQVLAYDGYLDRDQGRLDAVMAILHTYGRAPLRLKLAFPYRPATGAMPFAIMRPSLLAANVSDERIARMQPDLERGIRSVTWPPGQSWDRFRAQAGDSPRPAAGKYHVPSQPPDPHLAAIMAKLRTSLERRQQRMGERQLAALAAQPPQWLKPFHGLSEVFRRQSVLLGKGAVVWGALVQANSLLFEPGPADHPAMLVYSPDEYFDARPAELRSIGSKVSALKGTQPEDPELQALARLITAEVDHSMVLRLPPVFSSREIRSAIFMAFRDHIPNRVLSCGLFPILTHASTPAVMVVPFEFWPTELTIAWRDKKL